MSDELPLRDQPSLNRQFRRLADGQATPEEFQAIEARMATDPTYRADYVRFMDMEASLYEELSIPRNRQPWSAVVLPKTTRRNRWRTARYLSVTVACAALLFVMAMNWMPRVDSLSNSQFLEAQLKGLDDAAVVTHSSGIRQNPADHHPLKVGARLKPGVLQLRQGELQIDFLSGARVLLRAPAELHVLSSSSATLISGSVAARVTAGAGKFMLRAPDAAIGESGTEYAINVDRRGDSEVHVYNGDVEVSLLGDDGNTLFSKRLTSAETVRIDRSSRNVRPIQANLDSFATIRELDRGRLLVTQAYYETVRRSKPLLQWHFESLEKGLVPNACGPQYAGRIVAAPEDADAISISDGVAHFKASEQPHYLMSNEPLQGINQKSFSTEVWINPETFHWATVMNLIVAGTETQKEVLHLGLIELALHTQMVHKPSVIRYLHRHPPGAHTWGSNLFSPEACTPGQWTHIVTVKEPHELRLYFNGVLVRRIQGAETAGSDQNAYLFTVGQFGTVKPTRQFEGMLDELAIYPRALSEVEVSEHYWTMVSAGKPEQGNPQKGNLGPTAQRTLLKPHYVWSSVAR